VEPGRKPNPTTREIDDRLFISPNTVDHHIQHVYPRIGVPTGSGATLSATHNDGANSAAGHSADPCGRD